MNGLRVRARARPKRLRRWSDASWTVGGGGNSVDVVVSLSTWWLRPLTVMATGLDKRSSISAEGQPATALLWGRARGFNGGTCGWRVGHQTSPVTIARSTATPSLLVQEKKWAVSRSCGPAPCRLPHHARFSYPAVVGTNRRRPFRYRVFFFLF